MQNEKWKVQRWKIKDIGAQENPELFEYSIFQYSMLNEAWLYLVFLNTESTYLMGLRSPEARIQKKEMLK